jgi:hypothetical protein
MGLMSHERLKADKEVASLAKDVQRITELRNFLALTNNSGNNKRVQELDEELKRINKRLAELERVT